MREKQRSFSYRFFFFKTSESKIKYVVIKLEEVSNNKGKFIIGKLGN